MRKISKKRNHRYRETIYHYYYSSQPLTAVEGAVLDGFADVF